MTNTPKEYLGEIKKYLELYQKDLLKLDRSGGEVVRMRCNISEFINQINFWMGNLPAVLANEMTNQAVGMKQVELAAYPKKTTEEICESLESQLCTTDLPSYILNPLMFGIWEIKKREDPIDEFLETLHKIHRKIIDENLKRNMKGNDHIEYNDHFNIEIEKWEAKKGK